MIQNRKSLAGALALLLSVVLFAPTTLASNQLEVKVGNRDLSIQEGLPKELRNVAVLVCDPQDQGRYAPTATMMIATIHTRTGDAYMTVLQPNLLVDIPFVGQASLSQAYALGGENLVMKTLNELLGLNIRDYVCIDLRRFSTVVETVGGIEITLSEEEGAALGLPSGEVIVMNLEQTLAFMRLPKSNPAVDRQYDVVMQALFQATRERDIFKLTDLLGKSLASIDTNIGFFDMVGLGTNVMGGKVRVDQHLPAVQDLVVADDSPTPLYTTDVDALKAAVHAFLYGQGQ